jgi:subtilisin family serine protease
MARITINGITLDPEAHGPMLAGAGMAGDDSSRSNYILIQTSGPLDRAQKDALAATGAQILEYVPENAYIAYYPPSDLGPVKALPFVEWANVYLQGFKIAPSLRADTPESRAASLPSLGPTVRSMAQPPKTVDVVLHQNASPQAARDRIAAAVGLAPADVRVDRGKVRLVAPADRLDALAAIDEVRHVEEVLPKRLDNNVATRIMRADVVQASPTRLRGYREIVAVCDTGLDKGSRTDVHPAFAGRVQKLYPLGRATASDPHGHGTHVAGSVLGDGVLQPSGAPIRGAAPGARLVLQSVLDPQGGLGGLPSDLNDLFRVPYERDGARVHTNSWSDVPGDGRYRQNSREVDQFVWEHRDMVVCFAAGNDGTDRNRNGVIDNGSVASPSTAKNCITVGASESNRPEITLRYGQGWPTDFPVEPVASDPVASNPNGMAAFSSRGPTQDGRIKPDVVAPGTSILSALSRLAQPSTDWGVSPDPLYHFEGGTSMATPLVAGSCAVVRQYFVRRKKVKPSAALVKAMLINGAIDLAGQYVPSEAGATPNTSEGFGRIDLAAAVGPRSTRETLQFRDEATELDTGEEEKLSVAIASPNTTLKVTLVWTDFPGEVLQNDLDLIVRAQDGQERHGNVAPPSTGFDRLNNVEQVVWQRIPVGTAEITVRAFRVPLHPQSYALVVRTTPGQ